MLRGCAELHAQVAARISVNPSSLPYNEALLGWLRGERCRGAVIRALRPHPWAKNVLLFVPLLAAHRAADAGAIWNSLLGFAKWKIRGR
jgi:hypothetical protein